MVRIRLAGQLLPVNSDSALGFSRERFVCVEPGHVRGFRELEPGKIWSAEQVLSIIHDEIPRNSGSL
jgi:hypothetical protein